MVFVQVLKDEQLAERAHDLGNYFRQELRAIRSPLIEQVRGRGLLNAIVIKVSVDNSRCNMVVA